MTPRSTAIGFAFILALTFLLAIAPCVAGAVEDQPYETGPVIKSNWLAPYAPYTEGPYETGPVIKSNWLAPYAPYTEGPYETGPVIKSNW